MFFHVRMKFYKAYLRNFHAKIGKMVKLRQEVHNEICMKRVDLYDYFPIRIEKNQVFTCETFWR